MAGWYTLIIMIVSVAFTIALYHFTAGQVEAGFNRQVQMYRERPREPVPGFFQAYEDLMRNEINEIVGRIRWTLFGVNGAVLLIGGAASYVIARRTLGPIENSLKIQKQFSADASHELRTPLTAMRTEIEVALRSVGSDPKEYEQVLNSNLEEIQRLENISRGLLKLARHENNQTIQLDTVNIDSVISEAQKQLTAAAKQKSITVNFKPAKLTIHGDRDNLIELFVILLDNAIKYSHPKTTIEITMQLDNNWATISVIDQGVGIASEHLPRIFDRFYRADSSRTKNKVDGYGLGLPIARQIVERHHGSIEVRSEVDKGTTVLVKLPAVS
jgi:two-component system, OmpR family, sensor histidine kinase CiaH